MSTTEAPTAAVPPGARTLNFGGRAYPVLLPKLSDPRLHLASVIISIHILGQVALGFRVSVPQILVAIVTCAVMEVAITFRKAKQIVWPASAMLTGSGVALILRVVGTERGDHWTWFGWYYFAGVAAFSLATKYLIKHRGSHIFNPSNVGLVVAFIVLGRLRIEPLDFWWGPLDFWLALAYTIILVGGLLITRRLHLLAMAGTFWVSLAVGLGVVAASGHCMSASWSLTPVCDARFWWVVMSSPEILIFLFFMITDPKTIPSAPVARTAFAIGIAVASTFLMAPQGTEFGAKVGLLAGLVLLTPTKYVFDRVFATGTGLAERLTGDAGSAVPGPRVFTRGLVTGSAVALLALGLVAVGAPAREPALAAVEAPLPVNVDPATLPTPTADPEVGDLRSDVDLDTLALALAENLQIENEAMRRRDSGLLPAADGGRRLRQMLGRVDDAVSTGVIPIREYSFEGLHAVVIPAIGGQQATIGFESTGRLETITLDASGEEVGRESSDFATTFVVAQVAGERWLIIEERPGG